MREVLVANMTFYQAFSEADLETMDRLWAREAPVACVHPGWSRLIGRQQVMSSWTAIFANGQMSQVRAVEPVVLPIGEATAAVLCREVVGDVVLEATNVFVWERGGWKLAHHHASQVAGGSAQARLEPEVYH